MSDFTLVLADANPVNLVLEEPSQMTLVMDAGVSQNFVNEDTKFYLDGVGGTRYLIYNSTTNKVELWKKGVKRQQW